MPADKPSDESLEKLTKPNLVSPIVGKVQDTTAIVLFFDIKEFTKFGQPRQAQLMLKFVNVLGEICDNAGRIFGNLNRCPPDVLFSPVGDGIAIALWGNKITTSQSYYAIRILDRIMKWATLEDITIRCGIHSGPLILYEDINYHLGFCGEAVNTAKRIMDLGENHIICSNTVVEHYLDDIFREDGWKVPDRYMVYSVKHDKRVYVRNIYKEIKDTFCYGSNRNPPQYLTGKFEFHPGGYEEPQDDLLRVKELHCIALSGIVLSTKLLEYASSNDEKIKNKIAWQKITFYLPKEEVLKTRLEEKTEKQREKEYKDSIIAIEKLESQCTQISEKIKVEHFPLDFLPSIGLLGFNYDDEETGKIRVRFYVLGKDADKSPTADFIHPGVRFLSASDYQIFMNSIDFVINYIKSQTS